jgi:aspartyl aminopeptidase
MTLSEETMTQDDRLERLLDFLRRSPTPWHAVARMAERLDAAGFRRLDERETWRSISTAR